MELLTVNRLSVLGHQPRLAIFRLLMRRYPDRLPAGEIAAALDFKPSTLSAYLSTLQKTGLISQERSGTTLRYRVDVEEVRKTFEFLLLDCCRGRPDICSPVSEPATTEPVLSANGKFNVLFICTGNSARSIFAESILRHEFGERFTAWSAGTTPGSRMNSDVIDMLSAKGHDTTTLQAKDISGYLGQEAPRMDFIFTVCDRAANEDCSTWQGHPVISHWGTPDPVEERGTVEQQQMAFRNCYDTLRKRIIGFTALPLETLDRKSLQIAVDEIATFNTTGNMT